MNGYTGLKTGSCALGKLTLLAVLWLSGCGQSSSKPPVLIAINPWPGYELLHLAKTQGYFSDEGLNVELKEVSSLADSQRAYVGGQVDGFTSTIVEAVQAHLALNGRTRIVMVPDYSNGGDVIVAASGISTVADLKGRKVGCEVSSLGLMVIQRALQGVGLSVDDVQLVNVEQLKGLDELQAGTIDAMVTYPPYSVAMLATGDYQTIFTTREIPGEIIDVVSVSQAVLDHNPQLVSGLMRVWHRAYQYTREHPDAAYRIMAEREQLTVAEFREIFEQDLEVFSRQQMEEKLRDTEALGKSVAEVCRLMTGLIHYQNSCESIDQLIYRGPLDN